MLRTLPVIIALLAAVVACGRAPDPAVRKPTVKVADAQEVSADQIKNDLVGRVVHTSDAAGRGPADEWTFEAEEFKQAQILESRRAGNELTIVVYMSTRNNPKADENSIQVSGKLRLRYALKNGRWALDGVDNLTFQYSIGVAT